MCDSVGSKDCSLIIEIVGRVFVESKRCPKRERTTVSTESAPFQRLTDIRFLLRTAAPVIDVRWQARGKGVCVSSAPKLFPDVKRGETKQQGNRW